MIDIPTVEKIPSFRVTEDSYQKSKQFVKSPFRYPGGKFYAVKYILPFMDCVKHDEFREPFVGGGTIFFAKNKVAHNWVNDLETVMINTYRTIANPELCDALCAMLEVEAATPDRHSEVKNFVPSNDLEAAFRTFYLNRTSYSGIINSPAWGYKDGKSSPPQNWSAFLKAASKKLANTIITNLDFTEVVKAPPIGDRVLMYLDPPYYLADQKRAYTKPFTIDDHVRLAETLKKTPYLFCLSYDDCKQVRDLYSWAEVYERSWLYNTANKKGVSRSLGNELVITNYQVDFTEKNPRLF